jgi:hypothetical protein
LATIGPFKNCMYFSVRKETPRRENKIQNPFISTLAHQEAGQN